MNEIKILLTTDDTLAIHIHTLLNSISLNNKKSKVYILGYDLLFSHIQYLKLNHPTNIDLEIIDYDPKLNTQNIDIERVPTYQQKDVRCLVKSIAMYLRCYAPGLLPEVDKVIYLDIDTIVDGDLQELYNIETSSKGLAACLDNGRKTLDRMFEKGAYTVKDYSYLLDSCLCSAFNSGVLVMDLDKMRSCNATRIMMNECFSGYGTDQLLLNYYAMGDFTVLDYKWNVSANDPRFLKAHKERVIYHFHGPKKGWTGDSLCQDIYDKYKV